MIKIAILASGGGSNAEAIIQHFKNHTSIEVALILSNKENAFVLERAKKHNIRNIFVPNADFKSGELVLEEFQNHNIDYIVLAGFLLLIPSILTQQYPNKILNIHPALLPKYGGKGMYGHYVHQAVFDNFEKETGMTIHLVNEKYDEGKILHQSKVSLESIDTPDVIATKVLALEHAFYPKIIEKYITNFS